jgi:NAD(P)-dependent dehydrogenase (short-subunit alcohol dehydrogenase family)
MEVSAHTKRLMNLKGRKALLSGGAGHLGLAIGQALVELGATVAVLDRGEKACAARARSLVRAVAAPCDLSDEAATRAAVRGVVSRLGGLDILVHAAGYVGDTCVPGWSAPFEKQTAGAFEEALRVNLVSAFVMVQEARTALARSGAGSVILISSIYGQVAPDWSLYDGTGMANPVAYGASKGALAQMTRYLATLLSPSSRVNAISPGGVLRGQPESFLRRYVARTPLRRLATEEDVKGAVAFLASDLSAYVTGQDIAVDGGWTAW